MLDRLPICSKVALSNDVQMSIPKDSEQRSSTPPDSQGVLSKLPRTRPQRSSPRRAAAREATAAAVAAARSNGRPPARSRAAVARTPKRPAPTRSAADSQRTRSARARTTTGASAATEQIPRQGFECEAERANGTVYPPGGAELVASAAEIVGELAKAGLSTGERLLKDVLSRLPLS